MSKGDGARQVVAPCGQERETVGGGEKKGLVGEESRSASLGINKP